MDAKAEIAAIRKIIKSKPELKRVRVQNGKGTAWGYVDISGNSPDDGYQFTQAEREALHRYFGFQAGGNWEVIAPENRQRFIQKFR